MGRQSILVRAGLLAALALLSSCAPKTTLLEKPGPEVVSDQSLIHPPWEAMVKAGPGAEKDIDLETLNGPNPHPLLMGGQMPAPADAAQTAQATPPGDAAAATPAAKAPATKAATAPDPNATAIKAVAVLPVTGASPQGNKELTAAMRKVLTQAGWPVLDKPRKDALNVQGHVSLAAPDSANQTVKLDWVVTAPKGKDMGHVSQANEVPAHSLDGSWGEAADYASQGAADGIFKLIGQYR